MSLIFAQFIITGLSYEITKTAQHQFTLTDGTQIDLEVKKEFTLIVFNEFGSGEIQAELKDKNGTVKIMPAEKIQDKNLSAIYCGNYTGTVSFKSASYGLLKVSHAIFAKECEKIYVTNTRNSTFSINKTLDNNFVCYFNAATGSYEYKVKYDMDDDSTVRIVRNDNRKRFYTGNNQFNGISMADDPVVIYVFSGNGTINSTMRMESKANELISIYNLTDQIDDTTEPVYLYGSNNNDSYPEPEDPTAGRVLFICLIIIFSICIIGCIAYKIYEYYKNKREQEEFDRQVLSGPKKKYKRIIRNGSHYQLNEEEKLLVQQSVNQAVI